MASERLVKPLTTTGYAILSLLSLGEWTAYELERQAQRSLRFITPRARSVVYNEPKKLVRDGCATMRSEQRGRRSVAVYTITDTGRRALREWIDTPPEFPVLEASVLVRTLFGGFGDTAALIRSLHAQRDEARELNAHLTAQRHSYLRDGGPFPDRVGWISINGMFLQDYLTMLDRWSDWAADQAARLDADPGHAATLVRELADDGIPHREVGPVEAVDRPGNGTSARVAPVGDSSNVDVVRRFYGADGGARSQSTLDAVVWHVAGDGPVAGRHVGAVETIPPRMQVLDEWRVDLQDVTANGDMVVATVRLVGRRGSARVDTRGSHVFRLEDGMIAEVWEFVSDQAALDRVLAEPGPDPG